MIDIKTVVVIPAFAVRLWEFGIAARGLFENAGGFAGDGGDHVIAVAFCVTGFVLAGEFAETVEK